MLAEKVETAINEQINAEMWSAYLYLSMSVDFANKGYQGVANWMRVQWQEEVTHATKFIDYIIERGGRVNLAPITEVPTSWETPLAAFEDTLKHERVVTGKINNLMSVAVEQKDFATQSFMKWYIDEQVEEEANVQAIIDDLKMGQGNAQVMFMVDRELKSRVFVDTTKAPTA